MISILQELILDAQEQQFFTGTTRDMEVVPVDRKATVILGVRRSGKSTFLQQVIEKLRKNGVSRKNILYINFFDDRLSFLKTRGIGLVTEAYYLLYPDKKNRERVWCFFDEIQVVDGWESYVERLLRTENCAIYLTGSSAGMLSREIATQMRGRSLTWELFPFSFPEYLTARGTDPAADVSSQTRLQIQHTFEQYWETGGFPEVTGTGKSIRIKIHQEYLNAILFRDLVERHDISHPRALVDLVQHLMTNLASLYTLNRLTGHLQSLGHKIPKSTVAEYLDWLEDAYFLFTVRLYDASVNKSKVNPKKIYCVDHAFVVSVTPRILVNSGHLLENLVFVALRRYSEEIYYYRTSRNREVDFIVITPGGQEILVQVSESLQNLNVRKRETDALRQAMAEKGLRESYIITRMEEEDLLFEEGRMTVLPAWKFLVMVSGIIK